MADYLNTRLKVGGGRDVLIIIVCHHAGDFAGATANAAAGISQDKTIHNLINLKIRNAVLGY
jgi:hypothetical protein